MSARGLCGAGWPRVLKGAPGRDTATCGANGGVAWPRIPGRPGRLVGPDGVGFTAAAR